MPLKGFWLYSEGHEEELLAKEELDLILILKLILLRIKGKRQGWKQKKHLRNYYMNPSMA